jgi:hypothetical protein
MSEKSGSLYFRFAQCSCDLENDQIDCERLKDSENDSLSFSPDSSTYDGPV